MNRITLALPIFLIACGTAPTAHHSAPAAAPSASLALASPTNLVPIPGSASEAITGAAFYAPMASWSDAMFTNCPGGMRLATFDEAMALFSAGDLAGITTSPLVDTWTATEDEAGNDSMVFSMQSGATGSLPQGWALSALYVPQ